jgi:CO dehydrogenase maturation factor
MTTTIGITGKGGVGKSTIAAFLIRWLNDHGHCSVLAVDADSNVNLCDLLGVESGEAVGTIREEMKQKVNDLPGGMTKQQFLEYKIHQGLTETPNFDLITMGRPEGPGCYCYANGVLRDILATLSDNYEYVVIDNEAGMEHLSRRTAQKIDCLLIVSDPSVRGIRAAGRISCLMEELNSRVGRQYLLINRKRSELSEAVNQEIAAQELELLAVLDDDAALAELDANGLPAYSALSSSIFYQSVNRVFSRLLHDVESRVRNKSVCNSEKQ